MNHYPDRLNPGHYLCGKAADGETCPRCAAARKRRNYGGPRKIEHGRGPGRGTVRCPCGANTLGRARARGFGCCKLSGVTEREIEAAARQPGRLHKRKKPHKAA